ncbi:hypothetical protein [Neobacillus vireti]|uniref:hypothetical protein n=1 Tax=Neobacillus vireti TaxID=220686 RepID=UPI002FFF4F57
MEMMAFLGLIPILLYLGILVFAIYVVITILKLMKQRNEYLKEIRDEIKKNNSVD